MASCIVYNMNYSNTFYYMKDFTEIIAILLDDEEKKFPTTNKLILIEMIKIICIIEKKTLNIIYSDNCIIDDLSDFTLILNDESSIINIINELKLAEITPI